MRSASRPNPAPDAKQVFDRLLTDTLAADLKAAGFRKSGRKFHRRLNGLIHLIHFDGSWSSSAADLDFNIDLAVWSDRVAALEPFKELFPGTNSTLPKSGVPLAHLCHWRARIEDIAPSTRSTPWRCKAGSSNTQLKDRLRVAIVQHVVPCLDGLTDDDAVLQCIESNRFPNAIQPPLYVAAFYRAARPLREYDRFVAALKPHFPADRDASMEWRRALSRMRQA